MTITKEQFELFKKRFEIIETTRDISTYRVDLDYQDFAEDDFDDDYFLIANWELKESEPISSDGYSIIDKEGNLSKFPVDFFDQQRQDSKTIFEYLRNHQKE